MADEKEAVRRFSRTEKETAPCMEKEPVSLEDGKAPPTKILKHSHDADEAMKAFADGEAEVLDEATNRRLLRRIDLHIMPVSLLSCRTGDIEADVRLIANVCRLRTQLPRQNYTIVRERHGHQKRRQSDGRRLQLGLQHVLFRLFGMGVSHQPPTPTPASGQILLVLHHYVGFDACVHGCSE